MTREAHAPTSSGPAHFLAEFDTVCSLFRLYGQEHPAFRRTAELAAASATPGIRVSITSKGFAANDAPIDDPKLVAFAQRFRKLGLVGLTVNSQPTAAQITDLVIALRDLQRDHATAEAAVQRISQACDGKITAVPLRLGGLRLIEKTADAGKQADSAPIWRDLFAQACGNGFGKVNAAELAKSFESALGPSPSN